jgi:hypothetical protein
MPWLDPETFLTPEAAQQMADSAVFGGTLPMGFSV